MTKTKLLLCITVVITIIVILVIYYNNPQKNDNEININTVPETDYNNVISKTLKIIDKIEYDTNTFMDISINETLKYWTKWSNLIWFFDTNDYKLLYLYSCTYINKLIYKCPIKNFELFTKQFSSTWVIRYTEWKQLFTRNQKEINLYSIEDNLLFILNFNEKY